MSDYEAKFAREAKPSPSDWMIRPDGRGRYTLICIAPQEVPHER